MSKSLVRSIKNVANGYSSVQVLVRNATSNDPTGPTTYDMEEISGSTYQSQTDFLEIMDMLDRRLNDKGKNWRHVAKSLTVLDYLVRFGSEKCVMWAKDNLYIVKTLREFVHFDEYNNDQGAIIRVKAKELVSLLRDDERLYHERELAAKSNKNRGRDRPRNRDRDRRTNQGVDNPYDDDLEQALALSRMTAEQEQQNRQVDTNPDDAELQAALKLSLEEEEMRKLKNQQNENLLDLDDPQPQPQYYMNTGYYQQQQQYDMFGNPIQNPMMTGYYQQQQQQMQPQYTQYAQPQQPQFTGFNYQPIQSPFGQQPQQQPQEQLQPLKTGSNNPFAMNDNSSQSQQPPKQSLNDLASQQTQTQPQFFTQPQASQELKPQNTSSSRYGDHSHPELNNLLAQGTGVDTFGNTGDTRVAHHYTKDQSFLTSSGTGVQQTDKSLNRATTGNPFIPQQTANPTATQAPTQQFQSQPQFQQPIYTGYGFGNANPSNSNSAPNSNQRSDGPSLIDI